MIERMAEFTSALRSAGIPVAITDHTDALKALGHIPLENKQSFKAALAATLIKSETHRPQFDTLFNLYFGWSAAAGEADTTPVSSPSDDEERATFGDRLQEEMTGGDAQALREMARRAVDLFGRVENSPSGSLFFQYPVLRALDLDLLLRRAQEEIENRGLSGLERMLRLEELKKAVDTFRDEVRDDVRRRVAARKGAESVAKNAVRALPEDIDLLYANAEDLEAPRRAVRPLARKLATRVALKKRRASKGGLDMRKTVRASLSSGGVPFDLRHRHHPPHKPELYLLCDISDSVARFARFSLMLVHALASQFQRVRSFAFVDTIDEVTHLFEHEDFVEAVERMGQEARVVAFDGHSNYGSSLQLFEETCGRDLSAKATVLILGDARNNFRAPRAEVLARLRRSARHVYWLNPESEELWDTGDSAARHYEAEIDKMVEVRNLKQLEAFIANVL
jgi:uncharacterized protein with von Willebrand factor type A (vWA) domain